MSREIKRVPADFDWPLDKVWKGYVHPDSLFCETPCLQCEQTGLAPDAKVLHYQWYGKAPFDPRSTGSTPYTADSPGVRAFAERHCSEDAWFYGSTEADVVREAARLANLFNQGWMHHLSQDDVDALIAEDRLVQFTHTYGENGWERIDPPPVVTAAQVNEWSTTGVLGHDGLNNMYVVKARCEREGIPYQCPICKGTGSLETYPGQRAEAEAWEGTEPPSGDGWQVWETISEGSPISPVFATLEAFIDYLCSPAYDHGPLTLQQADEFIDKAWAPTAFNGGDTGEFVPGEKGYWSR